MKNQIILVILLTAVVALMAGCTGLSNNPTPTMTVVVSPTIAPTATPQPTTNLSYVYAPTTTPVKVDAQFTSQVSIVIGHWVESNYGWDNASLLRDVTYQHKDGDYYVYSFTVSGAPHTARIAYEDGKFTIIDVDNGLVV